MVTGEDIRVLGHYLRSMEEAVGTLETAYAQRDVQSVEKVKKFILELKFKIDVLLK